VSDLEQRNHGKLKVIPINIDAPESQPYLGKYNVRGTPTIVLLDRHGHVASNVPGWSGDQAVADGVNILVSQP
jgi:thioredoxin-related protein